MPAGHSPPRTQKVDTFAAIEDIVYQARTLGNIVRALELFRDTYTTVRDEDRHADGDSDQAPDRDEALYHLQTLAPWIIAHLRPEHDPETTLNRLAISPEITTASPPENRAVTTGEEIRVGLPLVDAGTTGDALVAHLERCSGLGADARLPRQAGPQARTSLVHAERAALQWVAQRWRLEPARISMDRGFRLAGPPAVENALDETIDGPSLGLAAGLVVVADLLNIPLPEESYATGALDENGSIGPISAVSAKISAVLRERPKTRWLLVPKGQRPRDLLDPRVVEVATLDEAAERIFGEELLTAGPIAGVNIEALIRRGVDLYEKASRFAEADTLFEVALRAIEAHRKELGDSTAHARDEILARWRLASSQVHRGKIEAALEAFSRTSELAEALWEKDAIEPRLYFGLQSNWAVALRDAWRYDEADALLTAILGEERRLRVGARELARTLGNRGELRTFAGRFENARVDLRASLEALRQAYPDEIPRALYTLGNLELASGNANAARRHYDAGLTRNKATQTGAARNEVFLRYGRARAYLAEGNAMAAIADCDRVLAQAHGDNAYPAQRLLALRGQARLRLGDHTTGHDDLQRAGDAVGDAGPLLAFGRRLAHAHLAIALLEENDDAHGARVAELVEGIAHTMDAVLGLPTDLAPKLRTQASALPQSALALAELLRHTIHLFPY